MAVYRDSERDYGKTREWYKRRKLFRCKWQQSWRMKIKIGGNYDYKKRI